MTDRCEGGRCLGQPNPGPIRRHESNGMYRELCETCATIIGHEGPECWCNSWNIHWNDAQRLEATFEMEMEASHVEESAVFAETKIIFSIRAWQVFCEVGDFGELDGPVSRIVSAWGQGHVVKDIRRYERGEMPNGFALSPVYKLTTTQGSTYRVDGHKAAKWLREWGW